MRTNWQPTKVARLDFETQSCDELRNGAKKYAEHPTTRPVLAVLRTDNEQYVWRQDRQSVEELKHELNTRTEGRTIVAHNAPFDSQIWRVFIGSDREWFDTVPTARASGLPGKLDDLGKVLAGTGKNPVGKRLIDMISRVKIRNGVPQYVVGNEFLWQQFEEYNICDVDLLDVVYEKTKHNVEPAIMTVDRVINDRGIPVSRPMLEYLNSLDVYCRDVASAEFDESTDNTNPRSQKQVLSWLQRCGFNVAAANKVALAELINEPEAYYSGEGDADNAFAGIVDALIARQELIRAGAAKIKTGLALEDNGRIHDQIVYWGAHTGRWAGRAFQPHNMPKMVDEIDFHNLLTGGALDYDRLKDIAAGATVKMQAKPGMEHARCSIGAIINGLLRTVVRSPNSKLSVADYGAVEARGVAWVAGCDAMLAAFKDISRDVYLEYASIMYKRPVSDKKSYERTLSKSIILGCGYGMAGPGFKKSFDRAASGSGKEGESGLTEEEAIQFVKDYRDAFPEIPRVWRAYENAVKNAVNGRPEYAGKCDFFMDNRDLVCKLPSGRNLYYRNARVESRVPGWAKLRGQHIMFPTIVFDHPHGYEGQLYGGRICENVVQAVCRDLLAYALVDLEREGLLPCAHVHDEILCESDNLDRMSEIMSTPPTWASGFPILTEGYCAPYWTKQSKRFGETQYLNGKKCK